jgi:hypothetical protein
MEEGGEGDVSVKEHEAGKEGSRVQILNGEV